MSLLEVDRLQVGFAAEAGEVLAVRELSYALAPGETLGIVGESGSGKSQSVLALMGLLAGNARISGSATLAPATAGGQPIELLSARPRVLRRVRSWYRRRSGWRGRARGICGSGCGTGRSSASAASAASACRCRSGGCGSGIP